MIKRLLLTLSIVVGLTACQPAQDDKTATRIDEIVRFRVEHDDFSGSVLVAKGDQIVFNKSYGLANIEWNIPNTTTTKFRLGSVTKQFTAAAILLLEEDGKLKLDASVKTYWPEAPRTWDNVTVFNLLTHTSGMPPPGEQWRYAEGPAEETIGLFRDKPLDFKPGSQYAYSNSGYVVLGYLIERLSGKSYADFLQERIFTPLEMKDTGVESNGPIITNRAAGYAKGERGILNAEYWSMPSSIGSGVVYSTTEDLLRWTRGLFGGKLLSAASLEKMTTPFKENYGLGVEISKDKGMKVIHHGGNIQGFNCTLAYIPDEKMTVVALSNIEGESGSGIVRRLIGFLRGDAVVLPHEKQEIQLTEDALTQLVGVYEFNPDTNFVIDLSNGKLVGHLGADEPKALLAEAPNRLFVRDIDAELRVEYDSAGTVTGLVLHQDGSEQPAKRLPDRPVVKLPEEVLLRHVGNYEIAHGVNVVFTLEDGHLMAKPPDEPKQRLYSESENKFFFKTFNAEIEFVQGKPGQTMGLIFRNAGQVLKAARKN